MNELTEALYKLAENVAINTSSSGETTLLSVAPGRRFRVLNVWLQAEAAVDVTFRRGTAGGSTTDLTGALAFAANEERGWGDGLSPLFLGDNADDFIINLSGAVQVNGFAVAVDIAIT